jgi:predicted esterase
MISFTWTDGAGTPRTKSVELKDGTWVNQQLPIVILLHGLGGNIHHMATPATSPGNNFNLNAAVPPLIDRGWHTYPNVGIWSIEIDPLRTVTGWQPYLTTQKYSSINYDQIDPSDRLTRPILELDALIRAVLRQTTKRLVFVCHSRGGLLLRSFLQRNRGDLPLLQRIAGAMTLHSPHQGSGVADLATAIHARILRLQSAMPLGGVMSNALLQLDKFVGAPGNVDLRTNSSLLADLRTREATPLPVTIPIHTFGGTSPRLTRLRAWHFDIWSAVPQWNWPPFHWQTYPGSVLGGSFGGIASIVDGIPILSTLTPEETWGQGDTLVTDTRSRLPGEASHRTNPLNHAQALWDEGLKAQVLTVLRTLG